MKRVLIVDDDERTRRVLEMLVDELGLAPRAFDNARAGLEFLEGESASLVLTDLRMPEMSGLEFLRELRRRDAEVPVIVLTAYGTVESAVEAMKLGALDFVGKPFDVEALEVLIRRALDVSRSRRENRFLLEQAAARPGFAEMLGESEPMQSLFALLRKLAPTSSTVLITGETGTGKELVARALHAESPRREALFVALNCSAIPGELLESELFGHVKGAFSGADASRVGKFEAADGGTLFLDEIGDLELRLQAKLLRVLQEGVVEPLGSNRRVAVDVRIVASTNRDLERLMEREQFRRDLFYRLNVFRLQLPPLRERSGDVPALAAHFLAEFGREFGRGALQLDASAEALLCGYAWPGNVRELRNVMERAAVLSEDDSVDGSLIETLLPRPATDASASAGEGLALASAVAEAEVRAIRRALEAAGGNKAKAARLLGIGERTLFSKLQKYDL